MIYDMWYVIDVLWYVIYDIWCIVWHCIWYLIYETWYVLHDIWCMISNYMIWYMIHDTCYMIYDVWYLIIWYVIYDTMVMAYSCRLWAIWCYDSDITWQKDPQSQHSCPSQLWGSLTSIQWSSPSLERWWWTKCPHVYTSQSILGNSTTGKQQHVLFEGGDW